MTKYIIVLIISFILFFSCKKEPSIVGTWISIDKNNSSGFEFFEDGTADYLEGFYLPTKREISKNEDTYLGSITNYNLKNDTLRIYSLIKQDWDVYRIQQTNDTLILIDTFYEKDGVKGKIHTYKKVSDQLNSTDSLFFDEIVFYQSKNYENRFSGRNSSYISIKKDGEITRVIQFEHDTIHTYQLTSKEINRINKLYSRFKSDMDCLVDSVREKTYGFYSVDQVSFIKDGVIRTVELSGDWWFSNKYFRQFFSSVSNLYQMFPDKMKERGKKSLELKDLDDYFYYFRHNGDQTKCSYLTYSEGYYLWNMLQTAKPVDVKFNEKYVLDSSYKYNELSDEELIYTDGRYYRYKDRVVDLGYNFIYENNFNNSFVDKKDILGGIIFDPPKIF